MVKGLVVRSKKNSKFFRLTKLYSDLLKTKHILRFFLGGLKHHQLVKLNRVSSTRKLFRNFICSLDYRVEFVLLRGGFVTTGRQVRQAVLHRHVSINKHAIRSYHVDIVVGDLVSLDPSRANAYKFPAISQFFRTPLYLNFLKKKGISKKQSPLSALVYFKFPSFLEVNFRTFSALLVKSPTRQDFIAPKIVSLYDFNQLRFVL